MFSIGFANLACDAKFIGDLQEMYEVLNMPILDSLLNLVASYLETLWNWKMNFCENFNLFSSGFKLFRPVYVGDGEDLVSSTFSWKNMLAQKLKVEFTSHFIQSYLSVGSDKFDDSLDILYPNLEQDGYSNLRVDARENMRVDMRVPKNHDKVIKKKSEKQKTPKMPKNNSNPSIGAKLIFDNWAKSRPNSTSEVAALFHICFCAENLNPKEGIAYKEKELKKILGMTDSVKFAHMKTNLYLRNE